MSGAGGDADSGPAAKPFAKWRTSDESKLVAATWDKYDENRTEQVVLSKNEDGQMVQETAQILSAVCASGCGKIFVLKGKPNQTRMLGHCLECPNMHEAAKLELAELGRSAECKEFVRLHQHKRAAMRAAEMPAHSAAEMQQAVEEQQKQRRGGSGSVARDRHTFT